MTIALGKKDHRGYVKVLGRSGVGVGIRKAFGKMPRRRDASIENKELKAELQALREQQAQMQAQIQAQMQEQIQAQIQAHMQTLYGNPSSSQVPNMPKSDSHLPLVPGHTPPNTNVCF